MSPSQAEKKPLNHVLGELFFGISPDKNGRRFTELLVEQVSHHPAITAHIIQNKSKGLRLVGHNAEKTSFEAGSPCQANRTYNAHRFPSPAITLPCLRIDELWYGSTYIELAETSYIIDGGHVSLIEYKGKSYFPANPTPS